MEVFLAPPLLHEHPRARKTTLGASGCENQKWGLARLPGHL
jgi:hypothetical protein